MAASTQPHLSSLCISIKHVRIDLGGSHFWVWATAVFFFIVATENEGKLCREKWVDQETSHLPQEATNPNLIQEDKKAVQESILAQV